MPIDGLPNGAFIELDGNAWAVRGGSLLRWTPTGYVARKQRPTKIAADVLTPPVILTVLSAGYSPKWHPSADNK